MLCICAQYSFSQYGGLGSLDETNGYWKYFLTSDTTTGLKTGISGTLGTFSNSLTNNFVNSFYQGKYISADLKGASKLANNNFFLASGSLDWFLTGFFPHSKRCGYLISGSQNYFAGIKFSRDYYNIVFYGNSMFAGKTADLSGFSLNYTDYQKIKFGLFRRFLAHNNLTFFSAISIVNGVNNYSIRFNDAHISTSEDGEYLNLDANYDYRSTKAADSTGNGRGIGFSTDFMLSYRFVKSQITISLTLEDAGTVYWNDQSTLVNHDTSISYTGVDITSLFDLGSANFNSFSIDSLKKQFYYSQAKKGEYKTSLPRKISFEMDIPFLHNNLILSPGAYCYQASVMPAPVIYLAGKKFFNINDNNNLAALFQLSYGGNSSDIRLGLGTEIKIHRFRFRIASGNIIGFIKPDNSLSQSINIQLIYGN